MTACTHVYVFITVHGPTMVGYGKTMLTTCTCS